MNWAGAAEGAAKVSHQQDVDLQTLLARAFEQRMQQEAGQRAERSATLQGRQYADTLAAHEQATKTENAKVMASLIGPGVELQPDQAAQFQGTPYQSLLETKQTLPSHSIAAAGGAQTSDDGGRKYVDLRPTQAQQQAAGEREGRRRTVELFKRGAPRNEIIGAMAEGGQDISAAMLDDPAANRAAAADRAREANQTREDIARMAAVGQGESRGLRNQLTQIQIDRERDKLDSATKDKADRVTAVSAARSKIRDLAKGLMDDPELNGITGAIEGRRDTFFTPGAVNALARLKQLMNSLSVEERAKLKGQGQISNFETEMLSKSVSAIDRAAGPQFVKQHLKEIVDAFQGDTPSDRSGGGAGNSASADPLGIR